MKRKPVIFFALIAVLVLSLIFYLQMTPIHPKNTSFKEASEQTGGSYIKLNKADLTNLAPYITSTLRQNSQRILTRSGTMKMPFSFTVPVDNMTKQLAVHISGHSVDKIDLVRPSGVVADDGDVDIKRVNLRNAHGMTVDNPASGQWTVKVTGVGGYDISVDAVSDLMLSQVEFVKANEDIHGGYIPTNVKPEIGKPALLQMTILGGDHPGNQIKDISFMIVDLKALEPSDLPAQNENANEYLASYTPGEGNFWVIAKGHDYTGAEFRREFIHPLSASSLGIEFTGLTPPGRDNLKIGTEGDFLYTIHNYGAAGSVQLVADDNVGIIKGIECKPVKCAIRPDTAVALGEYGKTPGDEFADLYLDHDQMDQVRVHYVILPIMPVKQMQMSVTLQKPNDHINYNNLIMTFDMVANSSP